MLRLLFTRRFGAYLPRRPIEPEPGLCCDEGCESCVWLVYANELVDYYRMKSPNDSLEKVKAEIVDKIESPNVKAFVIGEIEMAEKQRQDLAKLRKNMSLQDDPRIQHFLQKETIEKLLTLYVK